MRKNPHEDGASAPACLEPGGGVFPYASFFAAQVDVLHKEERYRTFHPLLRCQGAFPKALYIDPKDGKEKEIVIWCSNDYLGMGQNPDVKEAMHAAIEAVGAGSGGTRNISGTNLYHVMLEEELAALHQKEAGLLFTSGYVANDATLGTLTKIFGQDLLFFSDQANHASLIEGMRRNYAKKRIFAHNDLVHLEALLREAPVGAPKVIVFESVYSMEGDRANVPEIVTLAKRYGALTYVDEVHAVGLYGEYGGGVCEEYGIAAEVDIIQGTLAKGFGIMGGYVTGSKVFVDMIRSFAPGFIFSTSLSPVLVAGALASLRCVRQNQRVRFSLQKSVEKTYEALRFSKLLSPYLYPLHSQIIILEIGDAAKVRQISTQLLEKYGIYVQAVNYPTVPREKERLRITPSPAHDEEMRRALVVALESVFASL